MNRRDLIKVLSAATVAAPAAIKEARAATEGPWLQYSIKDSLGNPVSSGWFRETPDGMLFGDFSIHYRKRAGT